MSAFSRRIVLAGAAALAAFPAAAQNAPDFYPVPVEFLDGIDTLQGRVSLGNKDGDVHLLEFFDYNCGYCRRTARDIRPLIKANPDLKFTLINFAVLGVASIEATRVALAFSRQRADKYLDFHEGMFAGRGQLGADQALAVAAKLGANRTQLLKDADSEAVTQAMLAAVRLGDQFGFRATPSYLIGRDAYSGWLDMNAKTAALAAFRQCERAVCG